MHTRAALHHPLPALRPGAWRDAAVRRRRTLLVLLLLAALVLAQALGFVHRVVHGGAPSGVAAVHASGPVDCRNAALHWSAALFAGHGSDSDCRLLDALTTPGAAASATPVLPLLLSSFFLACFQGDFVARWAALFDARGPPVSR